MKWYFAINEEGCNGQVGLHAKLTVLSAVKYSDIKPILLYNGQRNEFTRWMEDKGVLVIDVVPGLSEFIIEMDKQNKYSAVFMGHWLRTEICQIEKEDEYVLYTDCDVVFLDHPNISSARPDIFASAPEFKTDSWNYFNSGVMIMNVEALRRSYGEFLFAMKDLIREKGNSVRDQYGFNRFYKGQWDRLDLSMNWKPYWGDNPEAKILHFHGPKLGSLESILTKNWDWNTHHGKQIGSLLGVNLPGYKAAFEKTRKSFNPDDLPNVYEQLDKLIHLIEDFEVPMDLMDTTFMNFRMFGDVASSSRPADGVSQ